MVVNFGIRECDIWSEGDMADEMLFEGYCEAI